MRCHRKAGRPIVYIDEIWVDSNLTFKKCWQDDTVLGATANVNSKNRLIVVHAGVVCMDNAPYHTTVENPTGLLEDLVDELSFQIDTNDDSDSEETETCEKSTGGKPSWQDITPFHPTTKRYWALWDSLHLRNGVLYRKWESDDGKALRWQLILPKTRVSTVLKELHGSPTGGHFGFTKTLHKVRERFYLNNVRNDVEKWCRTYDPCAALKGPGKRIKGRLQLYNVGAPFERIAFDILIPLSRSSDGNNNILVVMDYFTKWPEAYPIPDQEAPTIAEILVQNWISRYGVPLQLHSDQGRNSDSAVCRRLYEGNNLQL
ncbi:Protein NYNRIN like protein [Argiope bruennichi]|uniref:RNA-directed DNA polymerase n=1 Tax=Argiope bruennichi TaxID=94029 RepID=A0A8T0EX45_ARGBR|nr:Protein NYNRIN like protein [Argiope bruennichi]